VGQSGKQGENSSSPLTYYLLPERIQSRPLPPVEVVDMRQELQQGNRSFSRSLQDALQQLQEREQQESYLSTGEDTVRLFLAAVVM